MRMIARTPRFIIREFKAEEENAYLSLFDDEEVTIHLPKRTKDENRRLFKETLHEYEEKCLYGRWGMFTSDGKDFIGMCLLRHFEGSREKIEVGYVLRQKYWGMGIASEMVQILAGYGFNCMGASQIVAVTTPGNFGSQRVLEKAGVKRAGNYIRAGEELAYFSTDLRPDAG